MTVPPPSCPARTRLYRDGRVLAADFPAEQAGDRLREDPANVVWLDLCDPDADDLGAVVQEFGLHPLAVEDAVSSHERPKLDRYATHLFTNMYAVLFPTADAPFTTTEISAFITRRALITVRQADFPLEPLLARWDDRELEAPRTPAGGVGFLLHGLLDLVVDGHTEAVRRLDDAVDDLQDVLFEPRPGVDVRRNGFALRKSMARLRRIVTPMRELVERLLRSDLEIVEPGLRPYYQDVHDHVLHAVEGVDSARDVITSLLELALNEQGNELNVITRKLAAWAAIIAVPTAVTGFYGQNVPYPGFQHVGGFFTSTVVIASLSGGLYVGLRRRGWL